MVDTWKHLYHQKDTRRLRLDLTVPATTHRRNHITSPSFRRSSETAEPPPKPSLFFKPVYPSESFIASSKSHPTRPTLHHQRQTRTNHTKFETQTQGTATKYLKPATQSCCSPHPPEIRAETAKLKKLPPPGNKGRRRRSCGSLHLPESKPKLQFSSPRLSLEATASSLQEQRHHGWCFARAQTRRTPETMGRRQRPDSLN